MNDNKKRVLVNFQVTPELRTWFSHAAHAERLSMAAWLRKLAINRAAELVPQPGAERPAAAKRG